MRVRRPPPPFQRWPRHGCVACSLPPPSSARRGRRACCGGTASSDDETIDYHRDPEEDPDEAEQELIQFLIRDNIRPTIVLREVHWADREIHLVLDLLRGRERIQICVAITEFNLAGVVYLGAPQ